MGGRFDPDVLTPDPGRRRPMLELLEAGLAGVDPERLTAEALSSRAGAPTVVVAIGKAAPAMARGAARVLDTAERAGYHGALVWSVLSEDEASGYPPEIVAWIRERDRRANA